jgi:NAD(P)-dependent dehydrogenase (short-subunit alcohol dehydrogenase family)
MAIDWDKFQEKLDLLIDDAGDRTDKKLAGELSSVTRMTDEEIRKLFPDPADVKKLAELVQIVKQAGDRNEKVNNIVNNAEKFGGIILTLLSKFA